MRWCWPLLFSASLALANTEIVNFAASTAPFADPAVLRIHDFGWLRPRTTTNWSISPAPLGTPLPDVKAPHERWFVLDLPARGSKMWTLRLSYAASSPADYAIAIFSPLDAFAALGVPPPRTKASTPPTSTRRKYARIRAVHAGVRTPPFSYPPGSWAEWFYSWYFPRFYFHNTHPGVVAEEDGEMWFVLTLEPLLFGVLPASLAPMAAFCVLLLAGMGYAVLPPILAVLEGIAEEARMDLGQGGDESKSDKGKLKEE
ncbi:hypothetical protein MKEN_01262000 [Mycena kentingensis (nom. inval.)]|nr:hypothetical protein MKEN_01262000 [Mycena kentingensis (nom. inval.)]